MTAKSILCLNAGSSSLKFAVYEMGMGHERAVLDGSVESVGSDGGVLRIRRGATPAVEQPGTFADQRAAVTAVLDALDASAIPRPDAVGHRLVHGGPDIFGPARIDAVLLDALREVAPFAPLHLPSELAVIETVSARMPGIFQVACFDTAFHRTMSAVATRLPLPRSLHDKGVRHFGFHGLSYEYVAGAIAEMRPGRTVIAHLGSGASLAALLDGRSMDTTMGFTPTGGVMMATRSGDLDPGIAVHLVDHLGYDARSLERLFTHESGLIGVSETTGDMRTLLELRTRDERAGLAIAMFVDRVTKAVGSLATTVRGLDTLVFTGGIGTRSFEVRKEVCAGLGHLGMQLDDAANEAGRDVVSTAASACTVRVVETREELMVARHTERVLRD